MGGLSPIHWLIVLVIVVLVFGTSRLKNVGKDLGEALKGFKKGMQDDDKPAAQLRDDTRPPIVGDAEQPQRSDAPSSHDDRAPR